MYKLHNELVALLNDSLQRINISFEKAIINDSLRYDIYKTAFKCNIALKLQINAEDILANININNSKKWFKEMTIINNCIYFFLNNSTKYMILNNIFNQVLCGIFGICANKQLVINIQYQYQDTNSLSYYKDKSYYQALINLYKICGYKVQEFNFNNLTLSDYVNVYNMIKFNIYHNGQTSYFNGQIFMYNNTFTKYAQYICNYIIRFLSINQKNITICSKPYTIRDLKHIDKELNFKYSVLIETEPVNIIDKEKKYISNDVKYYNFNQLENFKFSAMAHKVNINYIYNVNDNKLKFVLILYKQIEKLIIDINNLSLIHNSWYSNMTWRLFKTDEILFNHISQLDTVLNFASKNIKLNILYTYLLQLCYLVKPIINSAKYILKHDNIDIHQLRSKLKLLIITKYIIKLILNIFNIRCVS